MSEPAGCKEYRDQESCPIRFRQGPWYCSYSCPHRIAPLTSSGRMINKRSRCRHTGGLLQADCPCALPCADSDFDKEQQ